MAKVTNEYVDALDGRLYSDTPKSVWAAIAISLLNRMDGEGVWQGNDAVIEEWTALYQNGIIPQKPPQEK